MFWGFVCGSSFWWMFFRVILLLLVSSCLWWCSFDLVLVCKVVVMLVEWKGFSDCRLKNILVGWVILCYRMVLK